MPRFPAPFSSHDYFNGNDPAMDLILGEPDLRSVAEFAADEGAQAALAHYRELVEKYKALEWWKVLDPGILEWSMNRDGYAHMSTGDLSGHSGFSHLIRCSFRVPLMYGTVLGNVVTA